MLDINWETIGKRKSREDLISFSRQLSLTEAESHDLFVESTKGSVRTITVEPLVVIFVIILYLQFTVSSQYIYYRVGIDNGIVVNETSAHVCDLNVSFHSEKNITDRIQSLNARYLMFIQLSSSFCTILTAPFYCVFSDRFGRKIMFLFPAIGVFVKTMIEIFIQLFKWNIVWFMVTEGFYGLCGGYNFAVGLSYTYIADITTQSSRTKRMAILGSILLIGGLCISLVSGFWVKANGYLIPYIFTGVLGFVCIIYSVFVLKEPPKMQDSKRSKQTLKEQLKNLFRIYTQHSTVKNVLLVLVALLFNFYYVAEMSNLSIAFTYLMSYPICMDVVKISIFGFLNMLATNAGVAISVLLLARWFADLSLILLCLLSGAIFSLQMAVATTDINSYVAAATNLFSFGAFPFIRGYLSKNIGHQDQGALFGGLALSESISGSITRVIAIYFYGATFLIFNGMVYLFLAGFSMVAMMLVLIAIPLDRRLRITDESTKSNFN